MSPPPPSFWPLLREAHSQFYDVDGFAYKRTPGYASGLLLHVLKILVRLDELEKGENVLEMKTDANEKYKCVLPDVSDENNDAAKKSYSGPTPEELMENMFVLKTCSYRIESYWTYELCHGKHLRQYHENKELSVQKKPQIQEYFLGYYAPKQSTKGETTPVDDTESSGNPTPQTPQQIKSKKIDGVDIPYFEVNMTDGTSCDLTNSARKARILYVCQPEGRGEIYELKETATCEYEVMVLTSVLCANPKFKPKNPPVSKISCHAIDGSPKKPKQLTKWDVEYKKKGTVSTVRRHHTARKSYTKVKVKEEEEDEEEEEVEEVNTGTPSRPKRVDTTLSATTDKQVLRDFLSGDHCLQGGTGWWKHEFCFGRYTRQFHDDQEGRIVIYLGNWNEKKHLEWIEKNPSKRPKEKGNRKSISLLYTDGDVCDLTGKRRLAEVRLKCVENPRQPHAVSIYLIEPRTCEYILGIESHLFCSIIDRADENGVIRDLSVV
ncbi:hypothetical protein FSP39_012445 [Pinctada imbricata]|uniref:Endoplasmic reticulum lectin 1 n=1 Tax=Pinctada imbricata TaxID=66713 RepID=A0AA89C3E6_PINIB|nr:hypothetical protein FSP39_012445 [Pinctada imbricata]